MSTMDKEEYNKKADEYTRNKSEITKQKQYSIASADSDLVQEDIGKLIYDLKDYLWHSRASKDTDINNEIEEEFKFLDDIELGFEYKPNQWHRAYAYSGKKYTYDELTERTNSIRKDLIVFNQANSRNYKAIGIHELVHLLVDLYGFVNNKKHNGYHCL